MNGTIRFPHLGIVLHHVIKTVSIGNLEIACYGMVLAVAMVTGLLLVMKVADKTGQKGDDYFDLGMVAIVVSVLCARIYYVVFSWDYYREHLAEIVNLREGGLAIYGGVIGGVLTVAVFCHIRKMRFWKTLDTAVLGLVWGQALGRWGNFFNREAFGGYTDNLFAMQLPVSDVRTHEVTQEMWQHATTIDGVEYIQVHPTFLYESVWNLMVLGILLYLTFRAAKAYEGRVFLSYLFLYGVGRFWIEGLRTDQLLLPGTAIPVSQLLSGILVITAGGCLLRHHRRKGCGTDCDGKANGH